MVSDEVMKLGEAVKALDEYLEMVNEGPDQYIYPDESYAASQLKYELEHVQESLEERLEEGAKDRELSEVVDNILDRANKAENE
ncbi:hypothetical protein [Natrinema salsiterrestre]|uniref:Uncharacterized protein n=1 Tax=Natrinema salsiterrestre TaxID=2950540 RepID=A0A9Q4L6T4_9EURY|nr:hypothetical protein [Natrinema salsiterrestre]MDF9747612.1 hypothetical protein [Natrinema salsiterrestre]